MALRTDNPVEALRVALQVVGEEDDRLIQLAVPQPHGRSTASELRPRVSGLREEQKLRASPFAVRLRIPECTPAHASVSGRPW